MDRRTLLVIGIIVGILLVLFIFLTPEIKWQLLNVITTTQQGSGTGGGGGGG